MVPELEPHTEAGERFVAIAEERAPTFRSRAAAHDREGSFPVENFEELKKSGALAAFVPEELGGLGLESVHDWAVGLERFGRGDASTAIALNMHLAVSRLLATSWRAARSGNDSATTARNEGVLRAIGLIEGAFR